VTRHISASFLVCGFALVLTESSQAGIIIGVSTVTGGGNAIVNPILTPHPNNDNDGAGNQNITVISKAFNTAQFIDIVFDVNGTGGTTEYLVLEGLANISGFGFTELSI
jgi:hypothetical protein